MEKLFIIILLNFSVLINLSAQTGADSSEGLDMKIFHLINNSRTPTLDKIISVTDKSIFFTSAVVPPALFAVSRMNEHYYDENTSVLLGTSEVISYGVTYTLKRVLKRTRPFGEHRDVNHSQADDFGIDNYSFPSGHSTVAFAFATSLSLRYNDKPLLIAGLYTYSSLIAVGRVYLGVHYPSDVVGGMIVGAGTSILVNSLRKDIIKIKNNIFNEKDRPDSNSKNIISPLVLLSFISTDIINSFLTEKNKPVKVNLNFNGSESYISLRCAL